MSLRFATQSNMRQNSIAKYFSAFSGHSAGFVILELISNRGAFAMKARDVAIEPLAPLNAILPAFLRSRVNMAILKLSAKT